MPETRSWQVRWVGWGRSAVRAAAGAGRGAAEFVADEWFFARQWWRRTPPQQKRTWQLTAGSAVTGLAVAACAITAAGPWESGQRTAERSLAAAADGAGGGHRDEAGRPVPHAPPVLPALGGPVPTGRGAAPVPTDAGLADALAPLLKARELGPLRSASVLDVATGREVFGAGQGAPATPASTVKLATAVAALSRLGPDHRIDTTVVADGTHRIVLVGGGDPTLTARASRPGSGDHPADLRALADGTARALEQRKATKVTLGYDTSAYSGPSLHPIGPNENLAPVSALMTDEARLDATDHGTAPRAGDPAAAAARTFAKLLHDRGITVNGTPKAARAPKKAARLAAVHSLPLDTLVERMLTYSDNDIAEALARQTALASGEPASFAGAGKAVHKALAALHLPLSGATFKDGSGLNRDDKVSAALLSRLLLAASAPDRPALRPVVTGLPVAAFTGTLSGRYARTAGAGAVRAKTGTLTGVNTLAGTVVDADGRLLVFAFMTSGTTDPQGAQRALDRLASTVANCGCR
ncbi:D-alanyl-D-alanine carboxypeptidase/D-alanyl-D-alanine-endopeptidase [Streptomyces sp. NPDC053427]|uniref:D-alanyl-D-alanine carboxypeptidase/D-alanyl-D-alanine endopeptidase n=1 Tax=Streptomyces sp. NPDC053427 TaxID=3365701 RepID=UPI0037D06E26